MTNFSLSITHKGQPVRLYHRAAKQSDAATLFTANLALVDDVVFDIANIEHSIVARAGETSLMAFTKANNRNNEKSAS